MPLKRVTMEVAEEVDALASAIGAANTLVLTGRRTAYNTDVVGIGAALGDVSGRAVVLGAGGTAQSALATLREHGIDDVTVLVRDLARTAELRDDGRAPRRRPADCRPRSPIRRVLRRSSPTPTSSSPRSRRAARTRSTPPGVGAVVLDVVYAPWPTPFAAAALAAGASVRSGLEMLLHQAVAQVELMTGKPGPVTAMRTALDAAVAARG